MSGKNGKTMILKNASYMLDFYDTLGRINSSLREKNMPNHGYIEVTGRCNFRCLHCFFDRSRKFCKKGEMSYKEICSVLRQFADMGIMKVFITGGEPFLRPDIFKILDYAKNLGFLIEIGTNASLITEDVAARLKDYGIVYIQVTLYGLTEESHKEITGSAHTYQKVNKAIDLLLDLWKTRQILRLEFHAAIFSENFHEIDEIQRFRHKMLQWAIATKVKWDWHICRDRKLEPFGHKVTQRQLEELILRMPDALGAPDDHLSCDELLCKIGAGLEQVFVNCWGDVLPCPRVSKSYGVNMRKKPIREIIEKDPLFARFRELTWKNASKCFACKEKEFCAPCQADWLQYNGNFTSMDDVKEICDFKQPWKRKELYNKYHVQK